MEVLVFLCLRFENEGLVWLTLPQIPELNLGGV